MFPKVSRLKENILLWYFRESRSLPWRGTTDPYAVWVSEVMLQQTQVETVIPYYNRFIKKFPSMHVLSEATQDEVLKAWENLGYYGRARNLHRTAKMVTMEMGGKLPETLEGLLGLPGIGPYIAAAILSIAYGKRIPAVDGNVCRVLSRILLLRLPVNRPSGQNRIRDIAASLLPETDPGQWNQALMDLGATICKPKHPLCEACPVQNECKARRQNLQEVLPVKEKRASKPHREMAAGIVWKPSGRFLIIKRPAKGLLGGLWGFPSAEKRSGEDPSETLRRTLMRSLDIRVAIEAALKPLHHAYTHFRLTVYPYHCLLCEDKPLGKPDNDRGWVSLSEVRHFALSKVDRKILDAF